MRSSVATRTAAAVAATLVLAMAALAGFVFIAAGLLGWFHDDLGIGARHLTVSTVGLIPGIRKLAEADASTVPGTRRSGAGVNRTVVSCVSSDHCRPRPSGVTSAANSR